VFDAPTLKQPSRGIFDAHRASPRPSVFVCGRELTDLQSETSVHGRTSDLSLYGCRVAAQKPFSTGTNVRVKISHRSASFVAQGRVSYVKPEGEMGIVLTRIDPKDQLILEKWD
jgi:PilZ domain